MCQFNISFQGDAESLVRRAKQEIGKIGGSLNGDASEGDFEAKTPIGEIKGTYKIEDQEMALAITKKPMLLPCAMIEKQLTSLLQ